ncbi:MAG TPA: hypothetical protein PK639_00750 [Candidatus Woesebacteria bacterium]|nr:hypothetical protein [Candidatus Woesebacteria bacterium]
MSFKKVFLISLFLVALTTRFIKIDWGDGFYFHPDENNLATALSSITPTNFNPHFYAYGQFPIYLGYFTLKLFSLANTFANSIIVLRIYSAIFSILALFVFYKIFPNIIFLILLIFSPGLIQLAHFGTTESLLILCFALIIYFSQKQQYFWLAIVSGIAVSTKLSALLLLTPILFIKPRLIFFLIFPLSYFLSSPYNLLRFSEFFSSMKYELSVANGSLPVFYTRQFVGTLPYLFPIQKIFPYAVGLPTLIISLFSFSSFKKYYRLLVPCLLYFLYFGQTFIKWFRFMSPIFFVFPFLASLFISKQNKYLQVFLVLISIIPGVLFINTYLQKDIRVQASNWIEKNIPPKSKIFSEAGNVINLPFSPNYQTVNFDFYQPYSQPMLYSLVSDSDYLLIPSRRVFKNNFDNDYYQKLFNGKLGFKEIKKFVPNNWWLLNPENAEETFSVFDQPTVRIYQQK